jgi:hypothetical protein
MEGPAASRGIKNRHYASYFTAHDDDDDDDDDIFQTPFLPFLQVFRRLHSSANFPNHIRAQVWFAYNFMIAVQTECENGERDYFHPSSIHECVA